MMSKLVLVGAAVIASASIGRAATLDDHAAFIQVTVGQTPASSGRHRVHVEQAAAPAEEDEASEVTAGGIPPEMKEKLVKMVKEQGKKALKSAILEKTPYGLGRFIVNDNDEVKACSDITSSLYCGMSEKVYNIKCAGWGGHSCLDVNEECTSISVQGICTNSVNRLNISCLGWGGHSCLPLGATANLISTESLCMRSEAALGIRSKGWGGHQCLDETATCDQITKPGICNDAAQRLGLECAGWGGTACLPMEGAACSQITTKHICQTAHERFNVKCAWGLGGQCAAAKI